MLEVRYTRPALIAAVLLRAAAARIMRVHESNAGVPGALYVHIQMQYNLSIYMHNGFGCCSMVHYVYTPIRKFQFM